MTTTTGRKAELFRQVVRQARPRLEAEATPAGRGDGDTEFTASDVEEMRKRIESAFGAADAA